MTKFGITSLAVVLKKMAGDMMLNRLRNRFMARNMLCLSVVAVVALAGIYLLLRNNVLSANEQRLQGYQPAVALVQPEQQGSIMRSEYVIPADYTASFRMVTDPEGNILVNDSILGLDEQAYAGIARQAVREPDGRTMQAEGRVWQYIVHSGAEAQLQPYTGDGQLEDVYTITCLDVSDSHAYLHSLGLTLLLAGLGMLALLFFASFVFANQAIKPIAATRDSQKQFVDNASHELKMPLAIINANMEALLASPDSTVASQRKWIDHSRQAVDRSARLINDMLLLSAMENPGISSISAQDMSDIVNYSIHNMQAAIFQRGLTLRKQIQPGISVFGNAENLARLVTILLENAVKYCDEGGSIEVQLVRPKPGKPALLSVYNTGQGIAEQDLPLLFDHFYRASQADQGHGLGLSLAKSIADSMGARIEVQTVVGEYARFLISFPAA